MRIIFVCTGNTCRSPMAEALLKQKATQIEVKSYGISALPGSDMTQGAQEALKEKGIEVTHKTNNLSKEALEWATLVLTMTEAHKQIIVSHYPHTKDKVFTLKEYANGERGNVNDPFGGSLSVYRDTLQEIETLVDQVVEKIQKRSDV